MNRKNHELPRTSERVSLHTAPRINRRIARQIEANVAYYAEHPEEIDERLEELDREWDIERVLETNASALALSGVLLGATVDRRFLLLPALVTGFLLQHALQGWCPPVPVFRRMSIRTRSEIDRERNALKYLRGDFEESPSSNGSARKRAREAIAAAAG